MPQLRTNAPLKLTTIVLLMAQRRSVAKLLRIEPWIRVLSVADIKSFVFLSLAFQLNQGVWAGTNPDPVDITKQPATIQRHIVKERVIFNRTKWLFHLAPQLSYRVVQSPVNFILRTPAPTAPNTDRAVEKVRIKITKVKAEIGLPIDIYLASGSNARTLEHEYGHVKICQHAYEHAENTLHDAAAALVGKCFSGEGANLEEATSVAVQHAIDTLASSYRRPIADRVNRISALYDKIDCKKRKHQLSIKDEVRMAETEVGEEPSVTQSRTQAGTR